MRLWQLQTHTPQCMGVAVGGVIVGVAIKVQTVGELHMRDTAN